MLDKLLRLGEGRMVKRLKRVADYVNTLSDDVEKLSDAELRAKTDEFKKRYTDGEDLDDLMPEAFAVAREAAWRVLDQRPFDVQVMGGAALHFGNVAEMKTGEGKTLTCVLPAYLNALSGNGVHVVTVNDYLAKRDAEWMGRVHRFLGLEVGVILSGLLDAGGGPSEVDGDVRDLAEVMRRTSICGLGQVALGPVMSVLKLAEDRGLAEDHG